MNLIFCKLKKFIGKLKNMDLIFWQAKKAQNHEFDVYKLKKHEVHFLQATETLKHEFQALQV